MQGLNPQQAEAVRFDHGRNGAVLVLAGAGSGKTTVLTRRIAFLAASGLRGDAILALTFTQDAAREMRERIAGFPALQHGTGEGSRLPRIGTFHAFAFGLLKAEWDGLPNWRRLGFGKSPALLAEADLPAWLARTGCAEVPPSLLEEWLARPFSETWTPPSVPGGEAIAQAAVLLRERWLRHLLDTGAIAFDDMVALALRLLREHPEVLAGFRERTTHVLVDEFQDTGPDQLELVKLMMGERRNLFLVGDDDQAIYGFRGADSGNIGRARDCFPGLNILKLEINYRSTPPIVDYANAIFRDKPAGLRKVLRAGRFVPDSPSVGFLFGRLKNLAGRLGSRAAPVRVVVHGRGPDQARWMAAEMQRLRKAAGLEWGDMAVLYRLNVLEDYYRSLLGRLAGPEAARSVVLSTVHAAKGLQYPAVFFVGLEDGILPYRRPGVTPGTESLAEEKRIFYVGVTRAERFLYLCACRRRALRGKFRDFPVSPFLRRRSVPGWLVRLWRIGALRKRKEEGG